MKLHKEKEHFNELLIASSQNYGLTEFQVEKDYYVSLLLKELRNIPNISIVFKGGTSLSKCYSVIDRFSEDIDIAIHFEGEKAAPSLRKKLKDGVISAVEKVALKLENEDEIKSRRNYNKYIISYPKLFENENYMLPNIIIETLVLLRPFPCEEKLVSNYITKFLLNENNDNDTIINDFELEPFQMNIQTIDRTFVDKLFAICDYHLEGKYERYSRHIYDVHMIWNSGLLSENLSDLVSDVIKMRQIYGYKCLSCEPARRPKVILNEVINQKAYKEDYNKVTIYFLSEHIGYEVCIETLKNILKEDVLPEVVRNFNEET